MAVPTQAIPFGMREIKVTPYTTDAATTLGTAVPLPASQRMSFSDTEDFTELRGDDQVVTTRGSGPKVNWDLEAGGISLAAYVVIAGGQTATSGSSPNEVITYTKSVTDIRPFFKAEGRAISDNGGDFHTVLYKCRATGSIDGEFSDSSFMLTSASGEAFGATLTGSEGKVYEFIHNETATAIS